MPKLEDIWPKKKVLTQVRGLIESLGLEHVPSQSQILKYLKCSHAVKVYGGVTWLSKELNLPTSQEYNNQSGWNFEKVVAEVKRVMDILGIHDRMPSQTELRPHSTVYSAVSKFGTAEVAAALGVKCRRRPGSEVAIFTGIPRIEREEPMRMEDIQKSRAFEIQREAGRPYGQIQQEESLQLAGTIDVSQYSGMQTYAERMAENG